MFRRSRYGCRRGDGMMLGEFIWGRSVRDGAELPRVSRTSGKFSDPPERQNFRCRPMTEASMSKSTHLIG